jgi:5-bromo-4-chloroindolyl phosphate hydrolysis protein
MEKEENISQEERSEARKIHFTSLTTYLLATLNFINLPLAALGTSLLPLIYYLTKRKKSDYVAHQALESFYMHIILAALFAFVKFGVLDEGSVQKLLALGMYIGIGAYHLGSLIWSSVSTSYGKDYSHILSPFKNYYQNRKALKDRNQYFKEGQSDSLKDMYSNVVENTEKKLVELNRLTKEVQNTEVKSTLVEIQKSLLLLWDDLKKSPDDTLQSRHFLNYSLDTLVAILEKYIVLQKSQNTEMLKTSTEKLIPTLNAINKAVREHHNNLLSKVNMNLDVEIEVLQKTIEMGGL